MSNVPLFPNNYPRAGQVALLCEGDLVGYESAFLGRWLREEPIDQRTVDVWPCGTANGLLAIADAMGRTVRVVVVEDRDFRTKTQAMKDCEVKLKDRNRRGVAMRGWTTWNRNEIENFFLDESVMVPVMVEAFRCQDSDVLKARDIAIELLRPFQALQATLASVRGEWSDTDPSRLSVASRPTWSPTGLQPVDFAELEKQLRGTCERWAQRLGDVRDLGNNVVATFKEKLDSSDSSARLPDEWMNNWAGKEILKLVRMQIASKFDAPLLSRGGKVPPVQWHELRNNAERDAMDRDIERAIQPLMIQRLWEFTTNEPDAPIRSDLRSLQTFLGAD